jgi:hypothetical protein
MNQYLEKLLPLPEDIVKYIKLYDSSPVADIIRNAVTWRVCIVWHDDNGEDYCPNYFIKDYDEAMELRNNPTKKHYRIEEVICEKIFKDFEGDDWYENAENTKSVIGYIGDAFYHDPWLRCDYCRHCEKCVEGAYTGWHPDLLRMCPTCYDRTL